MKKYLGLFLVLHLLVSCSKEKSHVFGLHNKNEFEEFKQLNLDNSYVNLLNPKFSTKEEYTGIINSWSNFHNNVNEVLLKNNFSWGISDTSVTVFNKIYFNKNGNVNYFLVNIINEQVSNETKNAYVSLLKNNLEKLSIDLKREEKFAQCGKVKYKNYE